MQLGLATVLLGLAAGPPPSELGSGDAQVVWLSGAGWAADVLPEPSPAMPIERGGMEARAGLGVEARAWPGDGEPADGRAVEAGSGDARVWNASLPLPSLSPMPQEPSLEPDGEGGSGDASVWNPSPQEAEPAPAPKQPVLQEPEPDAGGAESDVPSAWGSEGPAKPRCSATLGLLLCWMSGCVRECSSEISGALLMLVIAAMAAHTFGNLMSGAGFPAVTTFLAFGVVLGPYGTNIIRVEDAKKLLWCAASPPPPRRIPRAAVTHGISERRAEVAATSGKTSAASGTLRQSTVARSPCGSRAPLRRTPCAAAAAGSTTWHSASILPY